MYNFSKLVPFFSGEEEAWLLLANRKSIRQVSLNGRNYGDVFSNSSRTVAIDFDVEEGKLYWSDVKDNAIYRANIVFHQDGGRLGEVIWPCDGLRFHFYFIFSISICEQVYISSAAARASLSPQESLRPAFERSAGDLALIVSARPLVDLSSARSHTLSQAKKCACLSASNKGLIAFSFLNPNCILYERLRLKWQIFVHVSGFQVPSLPLL